MLVPSVCYRRAVENKALKEFTAAKQDAFNLSSKKLVQMTNVSDKKDKDAPMIMPVFPHDLEPMPSPVYASAQEPNRTVEFRRPMMLNISTSSKLSSFVHKDSSPENKNRI